LDPTTHLVNLCELQTALLDDVLDLGSYLPINTRSQPIKPHPVDGSGQIVTVLEGFDGARSGAGRGRETPLGVLDGQTELCLCSLVGWRRLGSAWELEWDLGLFGELFGKVLAELSGVGTFLG
jgi:hypothetical protein